MRRIMVLGVVALVMAAMLLATVFRHSPQARKLVLVRKTSFEGKAPLRTQGK